VELDPEVFELDARLSRALQLVEAANAVVALFPDGTRHTMAKTSLTISVQSELKDLFGWPRPFVVSRDLSTYVCDAESEEEG
jgi:hypothetical protein